MRIAIGRDGMQQCMIKHWQLIAAGLLMLSSVYWSVLAVFQAINVASSVLLLHAVQLKLLAAVGPMLLLYGALSSGTAILHALRGGRLAAARVAWESVAWSILGGIVTSIQGRRHIALLAALMVAIAVLLEPRLAWRRRMTRLSLETLVLAAGVGLLLPLIWMVVASLRAPGLPQPTQLEWWPQSASLANYARLGQLLPLGHYLRNSLLVVGVGVPMALLVAAAAGFALVQLPAQERRLGLALSVLGMAVPGMALWLPRFLIFRWLGLLNTPLVLLYPALLGGSPLCVLLLYTGFRRVPGELWDQARLDGAGALRMWWYIGLPLVRSMLVALTALVFGLFWGNFIDPLLYLSDATWHTLPIGLQALQQLTRADWPVLMAGAALMTIPAVLIFAIAQRALLGDLTLVSQERKQS